MRIAQIAPLIERIPPKKYGGTERVISAVTEALVRKGHDVTLFATGDSKTSARLVSVYPHSLREAGINDLYERNTWTLQNIGLAYSMQDEFDIIHDHNGVISLPTANISQTPVVMTLHNAFSEKNMHIFSLLQNPYFVAISKAQAGCFDSLNYIGNVYNGLPMKHYPFSHTDEGYLLFVGRITPEKGVHLAIEIARQTNTPLIIAAKLEEKNRGYYEESIKPFLSNTIKWIGEVNERERNLLMSRAKCFLHPVTWPEPFGLTLIEAMACGCPVVAMDKGSIPEVIAHGKTGFVASAFAEMVKGVEQIGQISREYCRSFALSHFSEKKMTDEYETIYKVILKKQAQKNIYPLRQISYS